MPSRKTDIFISSSPKVGKRYEMSDATGPNLFNYISPNSRPPVSRVL